MKRLKSEEAFLEIKFPHFNRLDEGIDLPKTPKIIFR